ncbi:MAG: sulfurtransferase [Nitriliruptoraceae bacterium]
MRVNKPILIIVGIGVLAVAGGGVLYANLGDQQLKRERDQLLVGAEELADRLENDETVVIDARPADDYDAGAIPGSVNVPVDALNQTVELDDGGEVESIVKDPDEITEPLQAAGIDKETEVVVYDNGGETSATRVFWVLDYYGHPNVSVLDGGSAAWTASDRELSQQEPQVAAGDFVPEPRPERHADFDYVQQSLGSDSVMLCNALSFESYADGSIEGSVNLHATELFADGDVPYFRADDVLAQMLTDSGYQEGQEFLSFCGRGNMASINYFAGRLLGLEQVRMYDGSLVDWRARDGETLPEGEA